MAYFPATVLLDPLIPVIPTFVELLAVPEIAVFTSMLLS
jgi:hypothetical protein